MHVILKWVAQFLLVPLLTKFAVWAKEAIAKALKSKQRKKENQVKQEAYDNAETVEDARTTFERLP